MNKKYSIKITGSGDKDEIESSLQQILEEIKWLPSDDMEVGDSYRTDNSCLDMTITEFR